MKKIVFLISILGFYFLFSNSVSATTLGYYSGQKIDEEHIYNKFLEIFPSFDISKYNKIYCHYTSSSSVPSLTCLAMTEESLNSLYMSSSNTPYNFYKSSNYTEFDFYKFLYRYKTDEFLNVAHTDKKDYTFTFYVSGNNLSSNPGSNFNINDGHFDNSINKLNFDKYSINLNFDENLFANDENFKKVCVNKNSSFSITKKTTDGVMSESDHDFIWFPYGISGIKQFNYSTDMSNGYYEFKDPYENFYFSSYDSINSIWNTEYMANNFESKGYTDKYKYYGYTAYLFLHWYNFNDGQTYNFFPIFELTDNVTTSHISSSGNEHGGGGTRLDGDEEIELSDEYCFYIKNEYEVNEVILDEWGDHYTSVNTPNGPTNYGTTVNKDNANSKSFLLQPLEFISQMSGTIAFINTHIYNFYMAMPLIVRTFTVTALIILIVVLIMKIGGYK